jgi:hypothetical protein
MLEDYGEVSVDRPYCEVSDEALSYADRLDRRNEKLETITKAHQIIGRYIEEAPAVKDLESHEEIDQLRVVRQTLAKAAGKFRGGEAIAWNTQRNVTDPNSEAEEGDDDVDDADILGKINQDTEDGCDARGKELNRIGIHLLKARLANRSGDHSQCYKSLNAALKSFDKFHQSLKDHLEG